MRVRFFVTLLLASGGTFLHAGEFRFSRPIAVVVDREQAFVANRDNGHISTVDLEQRQIVRDQPVGRELSDLVKIPEQPQLLAADPFNRELIWMKVSGEEFEVLHRLRLPLEPDRLAVSQDGQFVCISSPSESSVYLVDLSVLVDDQLTGGVLPLSVPVRNVIATPDGDFIAADRFGGRLFVIDPGARKVVIKRELRGHQIRGLAVDPTGDHVLVTHQILSRLSHSTYEDIHWGMLMQNVISRIPLDALLDEEADLTRARRLIHVGNTTDAAADPSDIITHGEGYIVTASGADKLIVRIHPNVQPQTISTGARPTRVARINERRIVVLNEFTASLQIVEPKANNVAWWEVTATIGGPRTDGGPTPELSAAQRGERLFYSARLSHDRWFSCNSCHVDGHTPDLLADTLSDGGYGNPKRIPSLRETAETGPWGWNGSFPTLEEQIRKSLATTMHGGVEDEHTVRELAAYVKTLQTPPQSLLPTEPEKPDDDPTITRGQTLFASLDCTRCHRPPTYTTPETYNLGLTDENGLDQFNPPSLRGVSRRRTYLHDGRVDTLQEAILQHGGEAESSRDQFEKLSKDERKALLEFLQEL